MAGCTKRTREAIANNEDIKDVGTRRSVMSELLNATVAYLEGVFGTDTPSKYNLACYKILFDMIYYRKE